MLYADAKSVGEYLLLSGAGYELPDDEAAAEALIERAEGDVDRVLSATLQRDEDSGRKLDPDSLTVAQAAALARAVGAQVEFRLAAEEVELVGDDTVTRAGDMSFGPAQRPPGPKAVEELAGFGLPWRSGTVAPELEVEEAA
jgi:hypothetical protein